MAMKRVRMLQDHEGAKKGDVVGFENNDEADKLVADGKAVLVRFDAATEAFVDTRFDKETGRFVDVRWDDEAEAFVDIESEQED